MLLSLLGDFPIYLGCSIKRTRVARVGLVLLNLLVDEVTNDDEERDDYSHANYPNSRPKGAESACTETNKA